MHRMVNRMRAAREATPPGAPILFTILCILSQFVLSKCRCCCRRRYLKLTHYPGGNCSSIPKPVSYFVFPASHFSGVQNLLPPSLSRALIHFPAMQPARHSLPELDPVGDEAEAGPVRRARDGAVGEALLELGEAALEVALVRDRAALLRRPGTELAAARAAGEVGVRLGVAHLLDASFHAHLQLQRLPVEAHRRPRVRQQLPALAALVVRVEDEALLIGALEQQHADRRLAIGVHRAQRERRG